MIYAIWLVYKFWLFSLCLTMQNYYLSGLKIFKIKNQYSLYIIFEFEFYLNFLLYSLFFSLFNSSFLLFFYNKSSFIRFKKNIQLMERFFQRYLYSCNKLLNGIVTKHLKKDCHIWYYYNYINGYKIIILKHFQK